MSATKTRQPVLHARYHYALICSGAGEEKCGRTGRQLCSLWWLSCGLNGAQISAAVGEVRSFINLQLIACCRKCSAKLRLHYNFVHSFIHSRTLSAHTCITNKHNHNIRPVPDACCFYLYFTHLPRSPQWTDLHEILHGGSSRGRNHLFQILCRSVQGFRICAGSNFAILPLLSRSPLGLCYRTPVILDSQASRAEC